MIWIVGGILLLILWVVLVEKYLQNKIMPQRRGKWEKYSLSSLFWSGFLFSQTGLEKKPEKISNS